LDEVGTFLEKIDGSLKDIAHKSIPEIKKETPSRLKKRKAADVQSNASKKKKGGQSRKGENLTLSQREERCMEQLTEYILSCGGKKLLLCGYYVLKSL
jgi:hypothetical protein